MNLESKRELLRAKPATEPLSGPFDAPPSKNGVQPSPAVLEFVTGQVRALLQSSPSYYQLEAPQREEMERNLSKIAAYSAALVREDWALSKQLGQTPVLVERKPMPVAVAAAGPPGLNKENEKPPEEFSPRAASNVARITRETLNAVVFPTFVADLIKGTYFAIVQATFQQMEAFGKLLANVAQTVDEFMASNITENQARDFLVSSHPSQFELDLSGEGPRVQRRADAPDSEIDYQSQFGVEEPNEDEPEEKLVPAARRKLAQNRHQMLAAMVMMGIQRIVVTSGRINAKMGFRIHAHDFGQAQSATDFEENNSLNVSYGGGLFGAIFGGPEAGFSNNMTYVSTTKKDSSDDLDVTTDLTGEVDLKFKSDYLPLERFAQPNLIALIQGNTPNPPANTPSKGGGMNTNEAAQKNTAAAPVQP